MSKSKAEFDNDGFQIVSKKRFSKGNPTKIPNKDFPHFRASIECDIEKAKSRVSTAVNHLRDSKYLKEILKSVSTVVEFRKVVEIVCFGLGQIGQCNISRYQLALLLCLKEACGSKNVLVHDPVFSKSECEVLTCFGLKVIKQNDEGSYIISNEHLTLVYLPHCPKQLTNNFLWSNWGTNLQNCLLLCNSFTSLIDNQPTRILAETVPYIHKIFPYTTEVLLENKFVYTDIFNDTSLHYFPKENLESLATEFWIGGEKPQYQNAEEFITSLMIEKLNI